MKRLVITVLLFSSFSSMANDNVFNIAKSVGYSSDLNVACAQALEDAKRQAVAKAGAVFYESITIDISENNGALTERSKTRSELLKHVTATVVNEPEYQKTITAQEDQAKCEASNIEVEIDRSQLDSAITRFHEQEQHLTMVYKMKTGLTAELEKNRQDWLLMQQQADLFKQGQPYHFQRFCQQSKSFENCRFDAEKFLETKHSKKVAENLGISTDFVQVNLISNLDFNAIDQATNGQTLLFSGVANYTVKVKDPNVANNQKINEDLAVLNNTPVSKKQDDAEQKEEPMLNQPWLTSFFYSFEDIPDNRTHAKKDFGLSKHGDVYVGGHSLGIRVKPGTRSLAFYLAGGEDKWFVCDQGQNQYCELKKMASNFIETGISYQKSLFRGEIGWVNYLKPKALDEIHSMPNGYMRWAVMVGIPESKSNIGLGLKLSNKQLKGNSQIKIRKTTTFGLEMSYAF